MGPVGHPVFPRHQIRVHLASSGHPILGDDAYGGQPWGKRWTCHRMLRLEKLQQAVAAVGWCRHM
jgi:23S rRNA-/tRNA-specific pseudouridylate synthase